MRLITLMLLMSLLLTSGCTSSEVFRFELTQVPDQKMALGPNWYSDDEVHWLGIANFSLSSLSEWGSAALEEGVSLATITNLTFIGPFYDPGLPIGPSATEVSLSVTVTGAGGGISACDSGTYVADIALPANTPLSALPDGTIEGPELAHLADAVSDDHDLAQLAVDTGGLTLCLETDVHPSELRTVDGRWVYIPWTMTVMLEGSGTPCPLGVAECTGS